MGDLFRIGFKDWLEQSLPVSLMNLGGLLVIASVYGPFTMAVVLVVLAIVYESFSAVGKQLRSDLLVSGE